MDSDDDDVYREPTPTTPRITLHHWSVMGKNPLEDGYTNWIRGLQVNREVHNTCESLEALPDEMKELILRHVIDFCEDTDGDGDALFSYTILQAKLLANVNTTLWRLVHELPIINYNVKSVNNINLYQPTEQFDDDGDPVEISVGMINGTLRFVPTEKRSLIGQRPRLLDVELQMDVKSFVNNQVIGMGDETIVEEVSTFGIHARVFQFPSANINRMVDKSPSIKYISTTTRTYMPIGPVEIDDDGDAIIDDEQPRRLLLTSATPNSELKRVTQTARSFLVTIDRNPDINNVRFKSKCRGLARALHSNRDEFSELAFDYDPRRVINILKVPIDTKKLRDSLVPGERAARKRAMELFSKVRELEDEVSITALMQENDNESIERTEEKRLKTVAAASVASASQAASSSSETGSSSTSIEARLHTYLASRERRLKAEYDQLMSQLHQLDGDNETMILSQLNAVEGRIAEVQGTMRALN